MTGPAPNQRGLKLAGGSALALAIGIMYYIKPSNLHPETAARNAQMSEQPEDANPTAQSVDVREKPDEVTQ
ncbi:hypothetical protein WOLCODRAFT_155717 [Wolfiporia cocos MD-104 SS10]|uniref:Uncharacterized protein n=1 Tax=Wolfiporia cocos (strain MD-104) TaxID=742152 RepID=A0A2H3JGC3_WOLCO|nr:hypothetical protein WOLCODRAFT_155717 [Wolfiporia cocos MD-104 SS10]